MKLAAKLALGAVAIALVLWLVVSFVEAEKEIRALCSMFHGAQSREEVTRTLETGDYLRYRSVVEDGTETLFVNSPFNLGRTRCVISLEDGRVRASRYE